MTQSFPWYKSYPAGVPHEINPDRYPSIPAVLDDIAARYPDKVGYTNMDRVSASSPATASPS